MTSLRFRHSAILKTLGAAFLVAGVALVGPLVASEAGAQPPGGTPTIQSSVTFGASGTIIDSIQVIGDSTGGSPTGNVSFYLCQTGTTQTLTPGYCTDVAGHHFGTFRLTTGADDTSTAQSAADTPSSAGTWCFSVDYAGSTEYAATSDNTNSENEDANECILVSTGSSTSASAISSVTVTLGPSGTVTDTVTVEGTVDEGSPTGEVEFFVCQTGTTQTLTTGPCTPTGSPEDTETLQAGADPTSSATSVAYDPTGAGTWCFSVVYGGDSNYSGSSDNTSDSNLDADECVLVGQAGSSSATTVSVDSITLGPSGTVSDSVTVTGNSAGGPPTGSVNFYVCQTGTTQTEAPSYCTPGGTPEDTETLGATGTDTSGATSVAFTPTAAGTWCFSAVYYGDSNYTGSSDNTSNSNVDPDECVLVSQGSSSTATTISSATATLGPSGTVTDSVTVTGNSAGGPPTGSVNFYVCQTGTTQTEAASYCTPGGTPEDTETLGATGTDTSGATSVAFTPTSPGTWCFSAVYGGDDNYTGSTDNTTSENVDTNECVFVSLSPSTVTSTVSDSTFVVSESSPVTDLVTVSGNSLAGAPQGTVDFYACEGASEALCTSISNPEGTPTLQAASRYYSQATSNSFSPPSAGTWCFAAVYVPTPGGNYAGSSDNVTGSVQPDECVVAYAPYTITSPDNNDDDPATVGTYFTFNVTTAGTPVPSIKKIGKIARGLTLVDNHNGTATISGTPRPNTGGVYTPTLEAKFGTGRNINEGTQLFTLTVSQAPAFKSHSTPKATIGDAYSLTIGTTGYPHVSTISESGTLPGGMSFTNNGNGTATLSASDVTGPVGTYVVSLEASNGVGSPATQTFDLVVKS